MQLFILIALMCLINTLLPDFIRNYVTRVANVKATSLNQMHFRHRSNYLVFGREPQQAHFYKQNWMQHARS